MTGSVLPNSAPTVEAVLFGLDGILTDTASLHARGWKQVLEVPARGLHGEGYRGHVFWDDVLVLPLLSYRLPELTKQLLRYRFRRLGAARRLAAENSCRGALFPWQSGADGREETPTRIFNPRSRRWFPDRSRLQRHVSLAVAYEVWQYYEITNDLEFLVNVGAELLIDGYPDADRPGIDNNAYTNIMVVWLMRRAIDTLAILRGYYAEELIGALGVDAAETQRWADITRNIVRPISRPGYQPVRRLRTTEGTRLGGVPRALREYRTDGPHPRGGRRHAQSLQVVEAGGHPHAVLPAVRRRAARAVGGSPSPAEPIRSRSRGADTSGVIGRDAHCRVASVIQNGGVTADQVTGGEW
jgi:hypothetical protein